MPSERVAVIDIGSTTVRLAVLEKTGTTITEIAKDRDFAKLIREVADNGAITEDVEASLGETLERFTAVAHKAGATTIVGVATSAMRDASNGADVLRRLSARTGIAFDMLTGSAEANLTFAGAIAETAATRGMVIDLGGGSLEVARFANRRIQQRWSLPLGGLRLSDAFFTSDPPPADELEALTAHVTKLLSDAGVPAIDSTDPDARVILVGGSARTLARTATTESGRPTTLSVEDGARSVAEIARVDALARSKIRGLPAGRTDSIVGGGLVLLTAMHYIGVDIADVSRAGLREGVARRHFVTKVQPQRNVRLATDHPEHTPRRRASALH